MLEEEGAAAKVIGQVRVPLNRSQPFEGDRRSDAQLYAGVLLFEQGVRQQDRAELGMDQAEHLEERAVMPIEPDRHHRRSGMADDAGDGIVPGRVGDLAVAEFQVGDFAGGKGGEAAAVLQPAD